MKTLVKMIFGSHLYGLDTPESDKDYVGVFLPSLESVILGKAPKEINQTSGKQDSKNTKEDVDTKMISLHQFLEFCYSGQTMALDMLHAPENMLLETSPEWKYLVKHRHLFYTRNLKAFVGYARQQAAKYGIKGSRLDAAKKAVDYLKPYAMAVEVPGTKLKDIWDKLPVGEHIYFHEADPKNNNQRMYEVCGRKIPESCSTAYALNVFETFYFQYGARAKLASKNKGIDWKAMSHAIRAAIEVREILQHQTITFPLEQRDFLLHVKRGELDYLSVVAPFLENIMEEVEELSLKSKLPLKVERGFWEEFLLSTYEGGWDSYGC